MDDKERAEELVTVTKELIYTADELIIIKDYNSKIEFMCECFSEALLSLFKCYILMYPNIDHKKFVGKFTEEMIEKLEPFVKAKEEVFS